jgi:branched-chain amino acid transport system substrate-binding protein
MSAFDIPLEQGMKMAIEDVNAKGGVLGRPLTMVTTDNGTDVSKIKTAAQEVLDKGAQFVVTSCDYDIGGPAARAVNAKNVIAISCAGAPEYGYKGIGPLTYNIYPGSPAEGAVLAEYAKDKGYHKPFVITDQTLEYTQVVGEMFVKRWKELGQQLAGQDNFQNGDASVASQISDLQQSGADVVVVSSYPPGGATVLRQIRAAGINLPILGAQGFDGTYWLNAVPNLSDFTIPATVSMWGDDPEPKVNAFFQRVLKETGKAAASANYPLSGYSSVEALAIAIQRAGSTDTAAVQKQLDSFTNEPLLIGPTTFTATCHIPVGRTFRMVTYTDGKPAMVSTRQVQSIPGGNPC